MAGYENKRENLGAEKQQKLLLNQHKEAHYTAGQIVRDIIIGVSDGLIVPFVLAAFLLGAALSGVNASSLFVLIIGIADVLAVVYSRGLGGYLAAKSEADDNMRELKREQEEIIRVPDTEAMQVADILAQYGKEPHKYGPIVNALRENPRPWLYFMMKSELGGLEKPDPKRVLQSTFTIVIAYVLGALVPLIPYMFIPVAVKAVVASVIVTLLGLLIFGYAKDCFTGTKPFKSTLQMALIGAIVSAAAFGMAKAAQRWLGVAAFNRALNPGVGGDVGLYSTV